MRRSHTFTFQIECPYEASYRFLSDPRNYAEWAAVEKGTYRPVGNGDWMGETPFGGMRHFRFLAPNAFGVFDHAMFIPGETLLYTPMRIFPNEEGTELHFTFFQRSGMSEEQFVSAIEWITTDFLTLKSLLEATRS
jgi:hypothetical protein